MGSLIRLLFGTPIAAIVTVGIFLFMYSLVATGDVELEDAKDSVSLSVTRQIEDTSLTGNVKKFDRPSLDSPPPPPPAISNADFQPSVDGVSVTAPSFDTKLDIGTGFNPDRDAQPLVRIPPRYPDRCADRHRNTERVAIEFDVTEDGQVVNVRVVDSTNSCFNRASVRAAERWKYQPKVENDQRKPRFGVRTTFVYPPFEE